MMRWILLAIPTVMIACAPAPPPPVMVPVTPEPRLQIAEDDRAQRPAAVATRLRGAWTWNGDVEVFRADGTGTYYRDNGVCYQFTYTVEGDVFTKVADRDSGCQGQRQNAYRFRPDGRTMVFTHVGSNFESRWEPTEEP